MPRQLSFVFLSSLIFVTSTLWAQSDLLVKLKDNRSKPLAAQLEFVEKALPQVPESEKSLFWMEKARIQEEQNTSTDSVLQTYSEVLKLNSSLLEYAHLFSARLLLKEGKDDLAKAHLEKIGDLSPNLQLQNEVKFELAKMSMRQQKPQEALPALVQLEKKNRSDAIYPDILWELFSAQRALKKMPEACRFSKKLYILHPLDSRLKTWPEGCSVTLEERRNRIKNLQWAGQSQKAWEEIQSLKSLKEEDPFDAVMLESLFHLHEGEVTEALKMLMPFYEKKKTNFLYMTTLATAAARAGDLQLAVGSYYSAAKISPRSKLARQALYQAAFLSYQFQDYDGATRRFQEVMNLYPNSGLSRDAKWHLAWIRYLRGDYLGASKALGEIRQVSKKGRDRIEYWMAMSLFRQGKYAEAKTAFEAVVREGGQSYYSITSLQRLRKIEKLIPKPQRPILTEQTRGLNRFSSTELMAPVDDFDGSNFANYRVPEESESEESLLINPLTGGSVAEGTANLDSEIDATGDVVQVNSDSEVKEESKQSFSNPVLVKRFERARDLMILGQYDWAKWDLYDVERKTSNKEYLKNLMAEYETIEQFHRSSQIAQNSFAGARSRYGLEGVRYLWKHAYPQAYRDTVQKSSQEFQVGSELIWGIMKAESSYKRDVVSPVGAIGLMQIMPNTGQRISTLLHEKGFESNQLFQPKVSIRLGAKYLNRLLRQFDQNYALTAAGYNAGPHRVRGWLAAFGQLDMDEFIEHIPFLETRNYVKRVLSNSWIYVQLYGGSKEFFVQLPEPLKIRFQNLSTTKETWEDI